MKTITFAIDGRDGRTERAIAIDTLVIACWTGRDTVAMEKHIRELEELGVKRPATTPVFYRVAADRLGPSPAIQVSGGQSSGEAEFVLLRDGGETFVGIASDHTDREVETYGITVSKQMCGKPCANTLWKFDDVAGHWDQLVLRAYATIDGERVLYQEGKVTAMRAPDDLLAQFARHDGRFVDGTAMLCGTLAAIGGIRPAERFEVELEDPVLAARCGMHMRWTRCPWRVDAVAARARTQARQIAMISALVASSNGACCQSPCQLTDENPAAITRSCRSGCAMKRSRLVFVSNVASRRKR